MKDNNITIIIDKNTKKYSCNICIYYELLKVWVCLIEVTMQ